MGLNGTRSWMGTKTFSAGGRRTRSSMGLATGLQSLPGRASSLPAAAAGLCMIYIHFFRVTKALKSTALKKTCAFVQEAFVDDSKAEQPQP